jgi:hypothetical protein
MTSASTRLRTRIWIAIFAILMNALAPSISHALAFASDDPASWEICRADRSQSLVADQDLAKPAPDTVGSMDHCGYCLPHAGTYSLLPESITGMGIFGGHALRPFLFYRAPQPLLALSAAPPRGPPAGV